jgi:hypothetical protein
LFLVPIFINITPVAAAIRAKVIMHFPEAACKEHYLTLKQQTTMSRYSLGTEFEIKL